MGHQQVELLMRRAGLQGLAGLRRWKRIIPDQIATDLVERNCNRAEANQLWVTDIERHEALLNRAVVKGHRLRSVAADRVKLRAA